MTYIFISHSTQDNAFTARLSDDLNEAGFETWVDIESIESGDRWLLAIQDAIEKCGATIVVMSRVARDSEWVEREALLAMDLKKPIHTALIEDIPLPLHLINRQYTDFRDTADYDAALAELTETLRALDRSAAPKRNLRKLSTMPDQENFFKYLAQLPGGEHNALIAKDLYEWGRQHADEVEFGGKLTPGFHVRITLGGTQLTLFSVWGYPKQPAVQVQFQYLADYPPYDDPRLRRSTLKSLNSLLSTPLLEDKADRRPTLPLADAFSTAEKLERFEDIMIEMIQTLQGV